MKKTHRVLFMAITILLVTAAFSHGVTGVTTQGSIEEKIDRIFSEWDKVDSPGCALAVIKDGQIAYEKAYGAANLDYDIPITPQTVFDIGSTSKQFTASCIILLALDGKISLDDDVHKYIPELPDYGKPVTIRHLIHHTSGVRDYGALWMLAGMEDHNVYTLQDIVDICARQNNLNFPPGEEHLYSNSGYILLAAIVERVSGMTLGAYAAKNIFEPLGMTHTLVYEDRTQIIKNRATGYSKNDKGTYQIDHYFNFAMGGDGQVLTTVEDLFLWDQNFYNPKVGGEEFLDFLHTRGSLNSGKTLDYAMGLSHGEYRGLKTVSHGGAWGGFRAQLMRIPSLKFSVIVLSNLGSISPDKLAYKVTDLYLADQLMPEKSETKPEPSMKEIVTVNSELFDLYAGNYQLEFGYMAKIFKENDRLWVQVAGQPKFELQPVSETEYYLEVIGAYITFIKDGSGNVSQLTFTQGGRDFSGKKIEVPPMSADELQEYGGEYTSEELLVTYTLISEDGILYLRIGKKPKIELTMTGKDSFSGPMFSGIFERNSGSRIAGLILDAGRVKNLKFTKK
ncbi:MAG: serine hydrolase [Candidatus Aminicenantes bacterium]|nr:serine hydrolase [Candidatus Aminicenantes bacterium]